ncbi:MAG: hypothetical protein IJI23_03115 [Lachnospiraceae bacterium]|nr:hypothetical protein [Lachnospiraceae bacterium]
MKGIRKLFLGLFLMTLIGVGFKVDAKAATPETEGNVYFEISENNDLTAYFKVVKAPSGPELFKFSFTYVDLGGNEHNYYTESDYSVTSQEVHMIKKMTATEIRNIFSTASSGGIINFAVKAEFKNGSEYVSYDDDSCNITGYKITPQATLNGSTTGAPTVTFAPNTPQYKLKGDTLTVNIASTVPKTFSFNGWILGGENKGTSIPLSTTIPASLGVESYLNADYKESGASLTLSKDIAGAFLYPNGWSDKRSFTFTGGYVGDNIEEIKIGTTNIIPKSNIYFYGTESSSSGNIQFKAPNITGSNTPLDITFVMDDGAEFKLGQVYIIEPSNITVTLTPSTDQTVELGKSITLTPSMTPSFAGATYSYVYDPTTGSTRYLTPSVASGTGVLTLTGKEVTTTDVKVKARASFAIEGNAGTSTKDSSQVSVSVTSPTLTLSDVYVNEGLSVPLTQATGNGNVSVSNITTTAGSYISITKSTTPALAKDITIKGSSATKTITNGITVDTQTADVTVYPKPTVSWDKSGSGSSMKYSFKLTMPKGAYHGSTATADITKARIQFVGKDGTYTTDAIELTDDTAGYSKKNKSDYTIDIKKLREIFDDICKEDKEDVEVTVYADGDKEVISDKKTLRVYKIDLDGSGGADYTIMGEKLSGHFYAIDGVTYEITTSPKSGYTTPVEKWDGTSFGTNTGGSTSFSSSKTIKAYYKNSLSSSAPSSSTPRNAGTAGEGMDDYDDVPKTGESKADIWILWSVLFVSILGAGFMIWKRFGLVRAIAEADEEVAVAEHKEEVKAKKKEKEDKIKMLKDLRNL